MLQSNQAPSHDANGRDSTAFVVILAYLGGVLALLHRFQLLDRRFEIFLALVSAGFAVHYLIPFARKQAFFLAVSLASALVLIPVSFLAALLLFGTTFYFTINSIPNRIARTCALGAILAFAVLGRARILPPSAAGAEFWKYFGAIFMFRVFLYARDKNPADKSLLDCLTYFFVAPSFYFLIFPVIDYRVFRRTYFARPQAETALSGVEGIFRGALQLLAFRLLFSWLYRTPSQVAGPLDFALFSVCAFASLLKITGSYHIAVGTLQLFGFDLPRPSRNYFLAESFLDYWNRSNVYWKNFMFKTVYMPLFIRFRARGPALAAAVGGVATFFVTWLLHGVQRFWLTGDPRFTAVEALYWAVMGAGVILSLLDDRAPEAPSRPARKPLQALLTFMAMSALWGFASMPSLRDWWEMLRRALG